MASGIYFLKGKKSFISKVYHLCLKNVDGLIVNGYFLSLVFFGNFVLKNVFLAGVLGIFQMTRSNIKKRRLKAMLILNNFKFNQGFF